MKKFMPILLLLFIALLGPQCKDDDAQEPIDPYVGCCGTEEAIEYTIGQAKLYFPNAFTPNGDGINDVFFPFFDGNVSKIESFHIYTEKFVGLYFIDSLDLQNPVSGGWDGTDRDGKKHTGLFKYNIRVIDNVGYLQSFGGSACSILCDSAAAVFKTKTGCFFPAQQNGAGGLDASLPTLEEDCFGQ